jgi:hypothetical protein
MSREVAGRIAGRMLFIVVISVYSLLEYLS